MTRQTDNTAVVARRAERAKKRQAQPGVNGAAHAPANPAAGQADDLEAMPLPPERPRLDARAYYGTLGDIVTKIEPATEADPAAIYLQLLACVGNAMGRVRHLLVEGDRHYPNLFVTITGDTSHGRKGTSLGRALQVMERADEAWTASHVKSGLTSGEGVIHHVRDARRIVKPDGSETEDPGSDVKNVLVTETEMSSVLRRMGQRGNTLSAVMRQAWDNRPLSTLAKGSPDRAANALVSIVAHITDDELKDHLGKAELFNGFANRFLWACCHRTKKVPLGDAVEPDLAEEVATLQAVLRQARARPDFQVTLTEDGRAYWRAVYDKLDEAKAGVFGAVTTRGPGHVLRVALILAAVDGEGAIDKKHLEAATHLWDFCEACACRIFGGIDPDAQLDERIYGVIKATDDGATRSEIYKALSNHVTKKDVVAGLARLRDAGRVAFETKTTGGRPAEVWRPAGKDATEAREAREAK